MPSPSERVEFPAIPGDEPVAMWAHVAGRHSTYTFADQRQWLRDSLMGPKAVSLHRKSWQGMDTAQSLPHATRELHNVQLVYYIPDTFDQLAREVMPDLPWADQHFEERVGQEPVNPPPSHVNWPGHGSDKNRHIDQGNQFSHTYPERFWPKFANEGQTRPNGRQVFVPHNGIRYEYGDLNDVVDQLVENGTTRQAVLPIFFPEDTGAPGKRVPCTLSYHFIQNQVGYLDCFYTMRACDFVRHFHNDIYFAGRLMQWVVAMVNAEVGYGRFKVGKLHTSIANLHLFYGDKDRV